MMKKIGRLTRVATSRRHSLFENIDEDSRSFDSGDVVGVGVVFGDKSGSLLPTNEKKAHRHNSPH